MSEAAKGHLAMFLFSALVAGSYSLGSLAANEISPMVLVAARFVLAMVLIGVIAALTVGIPRRATAAPWRYIVLGGLFAIYFVLMFVGLKTAKPVSAAAVFTLTPVMAAGFGWLMMRQVVTPMIALGLAIGGFGALWVIFRADFWALLRFEVGQGEMIFFVGCICHAAYTPLVRKLNRGEDPLVFTFGTLIGGAILLLTLGAREVAATDWLSLKPIVWVTIIYTTIFATALSFYLVQYATLRLPSSKVMAYTYLTPSWVILWEIALGHEAPNALVLGGVLLTVLALLLLIRDSRSPVHSS